MGVQGTEETKHSLIQVTVKYILREKRNRNVYSYQLNIDLQGNTVNQFNPKGCRPVILVSSTLS